MIDQLSIILIILKSFIIKRELNYTVNGCEQCHSSSPILRPTAVSGKMYLKDGRGLSYPLAMHMYVFVFFFTCGGSQHMQTYG